MKQLIVASTFYQCLSLAAAVDAGVLPDADERILVLANSSQVPELSPALQEHQGFAAVATRFDRVVDLAALLYPRRPVQFAPRSVELLTWQRLLRSHWDLGDAPVQIFMDSVQVNPALALAVIFDEADLYVHSDGLMTYSPTRKASAAPSQPAAVWAGVCGSRTGTGPPACWPRSASLTWWFRAIRFDS